MRIYLLVVVIFCAAGISFAQIKVKPAEPVLNDQSVRSSAAYAEVLFRKTELEAEIESLLFAYNDDYPKVREVKAELKLLQSEMDRLRSVKPADAGRLTLALGKLILGKVTHLANLTKLQEQYQDGHPSVKKEKRVVEIYEAAIKEILN